jgi:hypothetical protein
MSNSRTNDDRYFNRVFISLDERHEAEIDYLPHYAQDYFDQK